MRLEKIESWPQKLKLYQVPYWAEIEGFETEFIWDNHTHTILVFKNPGNLTLEQLVDYVALESESRANQE